LTSSAVRKCCRRSYDRSRRCEQVPVRGAGPCAAGLLADVGDIHRFAGRDLDGSDARLQTTLGSWGCSTMRPWVLRSAKA
jgi:hypothetical protein